MSKILQLRQEAKRLTPEERSLHRLLAVPDKKNLTLALFSSSYDEYHEWRLSMLRQWFPTSLCCKELVLNYEIYLQTVMEWNTRLEILEKHFLWTCPQFYLSLRNLAVQVFFQDYVGYHLLRLLYDANDILLEYRRHPNLIVVCPVRDMLHLLYSWYHEDDEKMFLTRIWKVIFLQCYRSQQDCQFGEIHAVETHLKSEFELCRFMPASFSFYDDILQEVMERASFTEGVPKAMDFPHVFRGILLFRVVHFVEEWETHLSTLWNRTPPWEAIALTRRFMDEYRFENEDVVSKVVQSFQRFLQQHQLTVVRMMHQHLSLTAFVFSYGGEILCDVVKSLVEYLWHHREEPPYLWKANLLFHTIESVNDTVSLPLSSLLYDLQANILCPTPDFHVFLCRNVLGGNLPSDEIALPELIPWKERYTKAFHTLYPCRKLKWLDWQSTVQVRCGATMSLVHWMVIRLLETHGPLSVLQLIQRLGWDSMYVCGIVHSLVFHKHYPMVERESSLQEKIKEDDVVTLRKEDSPPPDLHHVRYRLPVFQAVSVHKTSHRTYEQDQKIVVEAMVMHRLKREEKGVTASELLSSCRSAHPRNALLSTEQLSRILQGLVDKEYVRGDDQGCFYYVA